MNIKKPKTIEEAIDEFQEFLECDLFTKLKPEIDIDGTGFIREDSIENENEFLKYINEHFNILREQIKAVNHGKALSKDEEVKNE